MTHPSNQMTDERGSTAMLTEQERHSLFAVERRRLILDILTRQSTPIGLRNLATALVEREDDIEVAEEEDIERMIISLHHTHLPKMDEVGVLDYNPETNRIETDEASLVASHGGFTS